MSLPGNVHFSLGSVLFVGFLAIMSRGWSRGIHMALALRVLGPRVFGNYWDWMGCLLWEEKGGPARGWGGEGVWEESERVRVE